MRGQNTITCHEDRVNIPLHWRDPRCVFICSMSDLFQEDVPAPFILRCFLNMAVTPEHLYLVLTKRPERIVKVLHEGFAQAVRNLGIAWPLPNVWLGTSVENQTWVDRRIPALLEAPAVIHFVSAEPLLKPVDLGNWMEARSGITGPRLDACPDPKEAKRILSLAGTALLDWVIVGGESGQRHRKMDVAWVRDIRDQCVAAGRPFFLKQWGGARPGGEALLDGRPWREWPEPILAGRYGSEDRP